MSRTQWWRAGFWLGVVVGLPAAFGLMALFAESWAACHVGVNNTASEGSLLTVGALALVVDTMVFTAVFTLVARSSMARRRIVGAALTGAFAILLVSWAAFAWQGTPANYPAPVCPGNIPPWWPDWLPA